MDQMMRDTEKLVKKSLKMVIDRKGTRDEWKEWANGWLGYHYLLQDLTDVFHSSRKPAEVLGCYAVTQLEAAKEGFRILQHKSLADRKEIEQYVIENLRAASGAADEIIRGYVK